MLESAMQGESDGVVSELVEVAYRRIHRRRPSQGGWEGC